LAGSRKIGLRAAGEFSRIALHRASLLFAGEICGFFKNDLTLLYSAKSINIEVDCHLLGSPDDLPANSIIRGDDGLMAELFGAHTDSLDWTSVKNRFGDFSNSVEVNLNAMKEIDRSIHNISENNRVCPVQSTIFVEQGAKRYRPVISHVKELSADRISCEILLIDEVGGPLQNVDRRLGALLTAIKMALRIRWEIVRPFVLGSNVRLLARISAKKLRSDLQTCFNNIFVEAEFRGSFSPSPWHFARTPITVRRPLREIFDHHCSGIRPAESAGPPDSRSNTETAHWCIVSRHGQMGSARALMCWLECCSASQG